VLDGSLATRWSHQGIGQWLQLELAHALAFDRVQIAFYQGDTRITYFDIQVSTDGTTWEQVFTGQSSGTTNALETFAFPTCSVRFLRFIGRGNSTSTWNSVTEITLPIAIEALDAADSDSNGLPDSWEIHHFGSTGQDSSKQSFYITGIDPDAPAAAPPLRIEPSATAGSLRLALRLALHARAAFGPGYVGKVRNHRILTSPDLSADSWLPMPGQEVIQGDNLDHFIGIVPTSSPTFYRTATWLGESDP
jgi:hypothetical protein